MSTNNEVATRSMRADGSVIIENVREVDNSPTTRFPACPLIGYCASRGVICQGEVVKNLAAQVDPESRKGKKVAKAVGQMMVIQADCATENANKAKRGSEPQQGGYGSINGYGGNVRDAAERIKQML